MHNHQSKQLEKLDTYATRSTVKPLDVGDMPLFGQQIIEASAGTGKTFNITRIFLKLLLEKCAPVEKILIVTFTKAATEELKGRIAAQTNELLHQLTHSSEKIEPLFIEIIANIPDSAMSSDNNSSSKPRITAKSHSEAEVLARFEQNKKQAIVLLKKASLCLDEASIFTIHSFCQRVIKQTAFMRQQDFSPEIIQSSTQYSIEAVQDWFRRNQTHAGVIEVLKSLGLAKPSDFYITFRGAIEGYKPISLIPEVDTGFKEEISQLNTKLEEVLSSLNERKKQFIAENLTAVCSLIKSHREEIYSILNEQSDVGMKASFEAIEKWLFTDHVLLEAKSKFTKPLKITIAKKYLSSLGDKELINDTAKQFVDLGELLAYFNEQNIDALKLAKSIENTQLPKLYANTQNQEKQAQYSLLKEAIEEIRVSIQQKKEKLGVIDHDDTIYQLASAIEQNNETLINHIQYNYPFALIDEFQDTDSAQFSIFSKCYPKDSKEYLLLMIGDPKQAIYGFRGGDINTYLNAYQQATHKYSMQHNYRSSQAMIDAYNVLFYGQSILGPQHSIESLKSKLPFSQQNQADLALQQPTQNEIAVHDQNALFAQEVFGEHINYPWIYPGKSDKDKSKTGLSDEKQGALIFQVNQTVQQQDIEFYESLKSPRSKYKAEQARAVALEIRRLCGQAKINGNKVELKDIAVLIAAKGEAETMRKALNECNIPSVYLSSKTNIFESNEAKSLLIALDGILNVNHNTKFFRALSTDLLGKGPSDLIEFQENNQAFDSAKQSLFELRKIWERSGVFVLINHLLKRHYKLRSNATTNERVVTNYMHLAELLNAQSKITDHAYQLLNWLQKQIPVPNDDQESDTNEENYQRVESDDELVKIVTLHGSKGLEYPIVFIPFAGFDPKNYTSKHLCQFSSLQGDSDSKRLLVQIGTDKAAENAQKKEWEEEQMRLLYVGITRAVHRCYLGIGRYHLFQTSPLHSLLSKQIIEQQDKAKLLSGDQSKEDKKHLSETFLKIINSMSEKEPRVFHLDQYENTNDLPSIENQSELNKLEHAVSAEFYGNTDSVWQLSSFSKVSKQSTHVDLHDKGKSDDTDKEKTPVADQLPLRFTIQRSADTGNLLHNILEDHDFSEGNTLHIDETNEHLSYYLSSNRACDPAQLNLWLNEIISTPLPSVTGDNTEVLCSLNQLKSAHILKEPEFYFPLGSVKTSALASLMRTHREEVSGKNALPFSIKHIDLNGMMHGFIDLLFEHNGKFYVADYKSNHIGNHPEDYQHQHMCSAIQSHLYDLQYLIYSWALDRFLTHKLGEKYARETHFGGVYYLFLRGMSPEFPLGTGIYKAKLSTLIWQELDKVFDNNQLNDRTADQGSAA